MRAFQGFNESARLYAENAAVVEEMERVFRENVDSYFASLRSAVTSQIRPDRLWESATFTRDGELRYWWITDETWNRGGRQARVWFYLYRPELVTDGTLVLHVGTGQRSVELQSRIGSIQTDPDLTSYVQAGRGDNWSIFRLVIPSAAEDPGGEVAAVLSRLLRALRTALVYSEGGDSETQDETGESNDLLAAEPESGDSL